MFLDLIRNNLKQLTDIRYRTTNQTETSYHDTSVTWYLLYTIIKSTSVGDGRLSVMGMVDTRYVVSQPGADADR